MISTERRASVVPTASTVVWARARTGPNEIDRRGIAGRVLLGNHRPTLDVEIVVLVRKVSAIARSGEQPHREQLLNDCHRYEFRRVAGKPQKEYSGVRAPVNRAEGAAPPRRPPLHCLAASSRIQPAAVDRGRRLNLQA
ncbi:MAG: hypothetical protein M5U09_20545 [Gammaproteobacteria bacterium]|nr:hypothetical protein [Gammaproteobacteria bacterium]